MRGADGRSFLRWAGSRLLPACYVFLTALTLVLSLRQPESPSSDPRHRAYARSLSDSARRRVAEADRLAPRVEEDVRRGRYAAAESLARMELALRSAGPAGDELEVAASRARFGLALFRAGKYVEADTVLEQALDERRAILGAEHPLVAENLDLLGRACLAEGHLPEASSHIQEALALRQRLFGERDGRVAASLHSLGLFYTEEGYYERAGLALLEALTLQRWRPGQPDLRTLETMQDLAIVLLRQGDSAEGAGLLDQVLEEMTALLGAGHPDLALALAWRGRASFDLGKSAEALEWLDRALRLSRETLGEDHPQTLTIHLIRTYVLREEKAWAAAAAEIEPALERARVTLGDGHPLVARCRKEWAHSLTSLGKPEQAIPEYSASVGALMRLYGPGHPDVARTLTHLGHCLLGMCGDRARVASAESLFTVAAASYEDARLRAGIGYSRAMFGPSPYSRLATARLILDPQNLQAWPAAERALGRALGDLLLPNRLRVLTGAETAVEDSLGRELSQLEEQTAGLREAFRAAGDEETRRLLESTGLRLLRARAAWTELQEEIRNRHPVKEGRVFDLPRVQRNLDEQTAILGWLTGEWAPWPYVAWAYVIRHEGPVRWVHISATWGRGSEVNDLRPEPARLVKELQGAASWPLRVDRDARQEQELRDLNAHWLAGVGPHLAGVRRLVVLPNPLMLGLPAELLLDSTGVFLGDRYAVSYAPSATVYAWLREREGERRPPGTWRALLVGDPVSEEVGTSAHSVHLPRAGEELKTIAAAFPGADLLEGTRASEPALADLVASGALRDYQVIHFSTHALVDNEHPAESGLVLSPSDSPDPVAAVRAGRRPYDGRLTAREVAREWHMGAELVTLAGCSTALGQEVGGEGFVGLTDAFLRAGARTLLLSMWDMDDEASARLLARFYQNLAGAYEDVRAGRRGEPMPKAEALWEARQWLRTYRDASGQCPFAHPAYWAGFILVGDPD